jgi:hypothetical protein
MSTLFHQVDGHGDPFSPIRNRTLDQGRPHVSPGREEGAAALADLRRSPVPPPAAVQATNGENAAPGSRTFSSDQLQDLFVQLTGTLRAATQQPAGAKEDNPLAIARAEYYISQGLSMKFDGSQAQLAPWIKKFKALRNHALWRDATYLNHDDKRYDILTEFTKIKESMIKPRALQRCTPVNQAKSLKPENADLFYARILGKVVIDSVTDEFYTTLQNYSGDDLANDGPLLLWLILTHFHTSTVTYQEQLKQQIRSRSLCNDHAEDVEAYLLWLRHHLDILQTTTMSVGDTHNDLLDPVFQQLLTTKSTRLRRLVEDWHLSYHSEEKQFTPTTLVEIAEKKCKALRQSNQLYTSTDAEIMALISTKQHNHTKNQSGTRNQTSQQSGTRTQTSLSQRGAHRPPRPQWFDKPPTLPKQTHQHDNREWHWCPKCGNNGKWVCTHTAKTHTDGFTKKRRGDQPTKDHRPSPTPPAAAHAATAIDQAEIAKLIAAQVTTQIQAHYAAAFMAHNPTNPTSIPSPADDPCITADEW